MAFDPENRFLRCAYEHKYGSIQNMKPVAEDRLSQFVREERSPQKRTADDRFSQFVREERSPQKRTADDWFQSRISSHSVPSSPASTGSSSTIYLEKPTLLTSSPSDTIYLSKPSRSLSDMSTGTLPASISQPFNSNPSSKPCISLSRLHAKKNGFSMDDFPALVSTTTPKICPVLPNTEEVIHKKELPMPEPTIAVCNIHGIVRMIYDMDNPDYVPEKKYEITVEKAKSGSWSQRLKDSLATSSENLN